MIASPWKIIAMLSIACCALASAGTIVEPLLLPVLDQSYGQMLLRSKDAIRNNPKRSLECFKDYTPKLRALSKDLEDAESLCLDKDKFDRSLLPQQTAAQRTNLTNTVTNVCNKFTDCSKLKNALDFFRCYECTATTGTNIAHWIGLNAGEGVRLVEINYDHIEYDRQRCSNLASTAFVVGNTKLQTDLDTCINGMSRCGNNQTSARALLDELDAKVNGRAVKLDLEIDENLEIKH